MRNVDGMLNKERLIENTMEVNIYYQGHREDRDQCDRRSKVECNFGDAIAHSP